MTGCGRKFVSMFAFMLRHQSQLSPIPPASNWAISKNKYTNFSKAWRPWESETPTSLTGNGFDVSACFSFLVYQDHLK